jgi:hypothetical protein
MRIEYIECSQLLEQGLKRMQPCFISHQAGVAACIVECFVEDGDFRKHDAMAPVIMLMDWLRLERAVYAEDQLRTFSNKELLAELKSRLESG